MFETALNTPMRTRTCHDVQAWLLLQVSATHIATIMWHGYWQLPFKCVSVDQERLVERGYALERDVELVGELDPEQLKKSLAYCINSHEVQPGPLPNACAHKLTVHNVLGVC